MSWNLFKVMRDEREKDRQVIREGIAALMASFEAQAAQARVFQSYLDSFSIAAPPTYREWDEEASVKSYLDRREASGAGVPAELEGLSQLEQFELLLDKMDS